MNKSILVFKFGVIKSDETLSYLLIDICIVTCGTGWKLYSHSRLSLYSDPDRVVLHQAELMHLDIFISAIENIYPFIKF